MSEVHFSGKHSFLALLLSFIKTKMAFIRRYGFQKINCILVNSIGRLIFINFFGSFSVGLLLMPCSAFSESDWLWRENWRSSIDTAMVNRNIDDENQLSSFLGIDLHTVIVKDQRDWATLTFQPYYRMALGTDDFPSIDTQAEQLTWRIANVNFHLASRDIFNVKVGHFEIPFGIEFYEDTNGTLRQFSPVVYQQLKVDWGVSINGDFSRVLNHDAFLGLTTYEVALTRGSGNQWKSGQAPEEPYAFSGRIGRSVNSDLPLGVSWMIANTLNDPNGAMNSTTARRQLGIDGGYYRGLWGALWEVGLGERNVNLANVHEQQFVYLFGEIQRQTPSEKLFTYIQWFGDWIKVRAGDSGTDDLMTSEQGRHRLNMGIKHYASQRATLSAQMSYWLAGSPTDDRFRSDVLVRVRW